MHHRRAPIALIAVAAAVATLAGCAAPAPRPTTTVTVTPTADPLAGLSTAERVGQLFMVGTSATAAEQVTLDAIAQRHAGGVFLSGRSRAGATATAAVVRTLRDAASSSGATAPLVVATDQEGGEVQVLSGPGFDTIPSALAQSQADPTTLRSEAARWGAQLRAAGVDLDLAPVADVIPDAAAAAANPPIGRLDREYGYGADSVEAHAGAVIAGLDDAGVASVAKHFPGLGRVDANTDTTAGVTDTTITADSPDVGVYRSLAGSDLDAVMVSSAIYARIDPDQPAVFSSAVVDGLLRRDLGFDGIVVSDDLSGATQVASVAPGDRAIRAIGAGVDLVLVSRTPSVAPGMIDAVVAKAEADPAFARRVDDATRRILAWKTAHLSP